MQICALFHAAVAKCMLSFFCQCPAAVFGLFLFCGSWLLGTHESTFVAKGAKIGQELNPIAVLNALALGCAGKFMGTEIGVATLPGI